ncbi:hypothetical protein L798_04590 [Zootermopsis nevadensis]|uniref:Uncharacterized protein n=1 Tax=Zootermopsis nevadensis TaxID=136037 RepID=A0A067RAC5_ZOONE|nr:hypothetical protein L798_04590 [Zootermopsis nevadensis]
MVTEDRQDLPNGIGKQHNHFAAKHVYLPFTFVATVCIFLQSTHINKYV